MGSRTHIQLAIGLICSGLFHLTASYSRHSTTTADVNNKYVPLSDNTNEVAITFNSVSSAQLIVTDAEVHEPVTSIYKGPFEGMHKRHHSSADSIDYAEVPPPKVAVSKLNRMTSPTRAEVTVQGSSVVGPVISSARVFLGE